MDKIFGADILFANVKSLNGNIYSYDVLESFVEQFEQRKKNTSSVFGKVIRPYSSDSSTVDCCQVALEVIKLETKPESQSLYGEIKVSSNFPEGKLILELLKYGCGAFRVRSCGTTTPEGKVENAEFVTVDFVCEDTFGFLPEEMLEIKLLS